MHKAIFLDKDGTLVDNSGYPKAIPADGLLESEVIDGLSYLQERGYTLIIVSNQPWISNGRLTKDQVETIFDKLIGKLWLKGIAIKDYFYCPHQSSENCHCKKPNSFLIVQAARKYKIDLAQSYIIGDRSQDILAGNNAGVKTILVRTGCGSDYHGEIKPDFVIRNINAVGEVIP